MKELETLVVAAQAGNLDAFGRVVERYQNMAFAVAYTRLDDVQLAEDAAQEAFIEAYLNLEKLAEPAAFPGWLRTIVCRQCNRFIRRKRVVTIPLEPAIDIPAAAPGPATSAEVREMQGAVHAAIESLPEHYRLATVLFYLAGHSQSEIAGFLELPLTTVKKRLQYAREQLKERMLNMVEDYLDKRPSRDEKFAGRVQLFIAIRTGNVSQVKQLLAKYPSLVAEKEEKKVTASHLRIASGWPDAEQAVASIASAGVNRAGTGWSPLRWAVWSGDRKLVELLIEHGAAIEAEDWDTAAKYGHRDIIALFLEQGATINPGGEGQTPLHTAVAKDQQEVANLLLRNGAKPDARDMAGRTPLHWAATSGHQQMITLLLAAGADVNARDKAGRTPLYWAGKNSHTVIEELLRQRGGVM